jgi:glycosyltransferase involved in cell wall biosynthesis
MRDPDRVAGPSIGAASAPQARIGVVIPAYRAAATICEVVRGFARRAAAIVVVEDAGGDDTAERVRELGMPSVHVIKLERNRGVGGATKVGLRRARELGMDVIVKADADGQMDPAHLGRLVGPLLRHEADVTKGNRWFHLGPLKTMPRVRRLGNVALGFWVRAASGYWRLFDPTNGYVAWRAEVLELIDLDAVKDDYRFEVSMLTALGEVGAVVRDVPIPAKYGDETSHLNVTRSVLPFAWFLLGAPFRRVWRRYFMLDFSAISVMLLSGMPLLVFGLVSGVHHWSRSVSSGNPATAGTVLLSALPFLLGFNLLTFALVLDVTGGNREPLCAPISDANERSDVDDSETGSSGPESA